MNTKENRLLIFSLLYAVTMFSCVHLSLKGPNLWRNLFVGSMILILIRWVLYMGIIKKDFKKMTRAPTHCNALQAGGHFLLTTAQKKRSTGSAFVCLFAHSLEISIPCSKRSAPAWTRSGILTTVSKN